MPKKFIQMIVVALAVFAMLAFVYPDDNLSDDNFGNLLLQESSVKIATHRDWQTFVADSPASLFVYNKTTPSPSSSGKTSSSKPLSLAACVLRC
jgi:hypothetical protein